MVMGHSVMWFYLEARRRPLSETVSCWPDTWKKVLGCLMTAHGAVFGVACRSTAVDVRLLCVETASAFFFLLLLFVAF